jgi:hypothetical protein
MCYILDSNIHAKMNTQAIILSRYSKMNTILPSRLFVFITLILMALTVHLDNAYGTTTNAQFEPVETEDLPVINDPSLKVETVIEGLEFPTTLAF